MPARRDVPGIIEDYDRIRDGIEAVFPDFTNYNKRIRISGGFRLPLPPTERVWKTASGKAEFLPFQGLEEDAFIAGADVLKLGTIRSHDQYNTTIYGLDDRYRGVFGRRDVVFIEEEDIACGRSSMAISSMSKRFCHREKICNSWPLLLLPMILRAVRPSLIILRQIAYCRFRITTGRAD
jgi:hypothetical protein